MSSLILTVFFAIALAGCGGSIEGVATVPTSSSATPAEGTLLQSAAQLISTVTSPSLLLELNVAANQQLLSLSGAPVCEVLIYKIQYETVGGAGEATTASAALMVPTGIDTGCTGSRPIVLYAHGTTTDKTFSMTDLSNDEALAMAAVFASQGYIVVAPNYAGYDISTLGYHPFLNGSQ